MVQRRFICTWILIFVQQSTAAVTDTACVNGDTDCKVENSVCDNVAGTPKCKCSDGYKEDSNDGSTCVKISVSETPCGDNNACSDGNSVCDTGKCKCSDGYKEDFNDGSTCVDNVLTSNGCTNNAAGNTKCEGVDPNAECSSGNCACKTDYFPSSDVTQCVQSIEEITCTPGETENNKCLTEDDNAECHTDTNTCACSAQYYLSADKKSCVQKITTVDCTPGDNTAGTSECEGLDTNSECPDGADKCACKPGYKGTDSCDIVLTGQCTTHGDCTGTVEHSECSSSTCSCVAGYKEDNNICIKAKVSEIECDADEDCPVDHSECDGDVSSPKCKCSHGYKVDSNDETTCVNSPVLEIPCETEGCPVDNSECDDDDNKCKCSHGYKVESDDGITCVKMPVLEITCGSDADDCPVDNSECDDEDTTPKCKCSDGYEEDSSDGSSCVKSAKSSATSVWMTTSVLVTSMLTYLPRLICG